MLKRSPSTWSGEATASTPSISCSIPFGTRLRSGSRRRRDPAPARRGSPRAARASEPRFRAASRSRIAGRSCSRLASRSGFVRKRGSSASSGRPMRSQSSPKRRSFAAAIISSPSGGREDLVRGDQRERRSVAARHDAGCEARRRAGSRRARAPSRRARRSTSRPRPVAARSSSAATIPSAAQTPVPRSITRRADAHARPVGLARDADEARERLHQRVVARLAGERPVAPEGADRAVDEPLVARAQRVAAEPEPLGRARAAATARTRRRRRRAAAAPPGPLVA